MSPPTSPFRNIRQVLSLHATVTPDKVFLITYDADGSRAELTYAEFNGRVHQAASFLYDDLGIRRGDRVATLLENDSSTAILYFACWLIGASVVTLHLSNQILSRALVVRESRAVVCFVHTDHLTDLERSLQVMAEHGLGLPNIRQIVTVGSTADHYMEFNAEIANRPNTFISTTERPTLAAEALLVYADDRGAALTQGDLLTQAFNWAHFHAITGNQRVLGVLPLTSAREIVLSLILPLSVGASVVLTCQFADFWGRCARESVQVVNGDSTVLQAALDHAAGQAAQGQSIWGDGVAQWDLRRFRFILCADLPENLAQTFTDTFGIAPVLLNWKLGNGE